MAGGSGVDVGGSAIIVDPETVGSDSVVASCGIGVENDDSDVC